MQIELNSFLLCVLRRGCKCQTNRQIHKQDCSSNSMHNEQFAEPRIWSTPYKGCSPFLRCVSCHMLEIMLVPFFSFISWHVQRIFNGSSNVSDVPRVYQNSSSAKRLCRTCKLETKRKIWQKSNLIISLTQTISRLKLHLLKQITKLFF